MLNNVEKKALLLGSAGWGKSINKAEAFKIIEEFQNNGLKIIDSATNYPINGVKMDYGLALSWLGEWIRKSDIGDAKIFVKIGSVDNSGNDDVDLSAKSIRETISKLQELLEDNIYGIGIHWDNRDDYEEVLETVLTMKEFQSKDFKLGISGIKNPSLYKQTENVDSDWLIQVKEHPADKLSRQNYCNYFPNNTYIAYGLQHFLNQEDGGDSSRKRELYLDGIKYFMASVDLGGLIVSPRTLNQARETLEYFNSFKIRQT